MSFNAIMIVNILLQILFWTLSISCEIYNSSKIDGSSYPHFYNKIAYFILDEPIPEILLMIIYIHMFNISCIHSFVFPSW